jgi:ribosomal protein RSM22 (predicted rRNA methylase)
VRLPDAIERAIDREAATVPGKALARAAESLSARYREPAGADADAGPAHALTDIERLAYAVVRAPATYAAVATVLAELRQRAPDLRVASLLDLGAGPGAATWAALAQRGDLERATLIEQDRGFIDLGRRLIAEVENTPAMAPTAASAPARQIEWRRVDLGASSQSHAQPQPPSQSPSQPQPQPHAQPPSPLPAHDLVIVSYALGELRDRSALIARAWAATGQALIVIEPGTPHHFDGILAARDYLIHEGAVIVAPCPHASACPMAGVDWCHMPARVERTSLHRRLKAGVLPYEDEKFSYVIAVRAPVSAPPALARIVRRPEIQKGFVTLTLCTPEGLQRQGVPRSQREAFKRARKATWGDAF